MSIKTTKEIIASNLTNRCTYVDATGKTLTTGDTCLIFNVEKELEHMSARRRTHKRPKKILEQNLLTNRFLVGVFVKTNNRNECKFIFKSVESGKFVMRTMHDENVKGITHNFTNPYKLNCIAGDYSHMDPAWKEYTGYNGAISAAEKFLQLVNNAN